MFDLADNAALPSGGASDWAREMSANQGMQKKALDATLDAAREVDFKHGTNITGAVWENIINGRFRVFP